MTQFLKRPLTCELSNLPSVETTEESVSGEPSEMPMVSKDFLQEQTGCLECGSKSKSKCGLEINISKQHTIKHIICANDEVEEVT